jgi:hypothetical protein
MIKVRVFDRHRVWLAENSIAHTVVSTRLDPYNFEPVPIQVELTEKDAILFKLRWGDN